MLAPLAQAVELRDVRLWDGPESTRVVFDLLGGTEHKFFTLDNPSRIVIDIADARRAPGLSFDGLGKGVVKSVRTGPRDGGLRVVLDLADEVNPKSFGLEPNGSYGHRLIFDLYPKHGSSELALKDEAPATVAMIPPTAKEKPAAEPAAKPEAKPEPRQDPKTEVRKPPQARFNEKPIVIAIDAGHGGEDPGARGVSGLREKDVTLRIAKKLAALVDATPGYKAVLTRKGDYFIALRGRTAIARKAQADMFISIHANSLPTPRDVRGASVYVVSERGATSEHAKMLANLENAADLVGGVDLHSQHDDVASVLLDISQTAVREASFDLGSRLLESLGSVNRLQKADVQQAGFAVLKSPDMPSALVETAFLSHPEDERLLAQNDFQDALASSILSGIKGYFGLYRPQQQLVYADIPTASAGPMPVNLKRRR
ncbi:MAG: N-acetylmuramoyl-L-alanine amidase [Stagnimonas sp.]|nr:N-acetylmuramoyl-L-alanine amidase [Stagnimonas sp.]